MKRRADKLEEKLKIIKAAGCGLSAPLQHKLTALESLYGQYSVHTLCDALDVSRGTFYNHVLRRRKNKLLEMRTEKINIMRLPLKMSGKLIILTNEFCKILRDHEKTENTESARSALRKYIEMLEEFYQTM